MLRTEEQAKRMWCPMVRVAINAEHYHGGNRFEPIGDTTQPRSRMDGYTTCIGSECMMWRKGLLKNGDNYANGAGYCGLAGKVDY